MDDKFISMYTRSEEVVSIVVLSIIMMVSLFGNVGMLVIFYRNDKLWNSTNMLIVNLSLAGILVTLLCMPFHLVSTSMHRWPFVEGAFCKFNAFAASQLLLATIFTHVLISVDRYYAVVKPFDRSMTVKRTWHLIGFMWTIAVVMTLLPMFAVGRYAYNHTTLVCGVGFPETTGGTVYIVTLATIAFTIPIAIMTYVYVRVFIAVRRHTERLKESAVTSFEVLKLQKRLIRTSFFSVVCFLICWTPFCCFCMTAVIVDSPDDFPYGLGLASYWCGYSYSALNPVLICWMSPRFHDGFTQLLSSAIALPSRCFHWFRRKLRKDTFELREDKTDWQTEKYKKSEPFESQTAMKPLHLHIPPWCLIDCCEGMSSCSPDTSCTASSLSLISSIAYPVENTAL